MLKSLTRLTACGLITLLVACGDSSTDLESGRQSQATSNEDSKSRHVNILYWQAVSTLNPFLSGGTKDIEAASMVVEPLAHYDENGEIVPILVQEIPSLSNGGIAPDLMSITWNLRQDIVWSDNTPLTAHDVVFTGEYCMNDDVGCNASSYLADVESFTALDDHTIRINFLKRKPFPFGPFVGSAIPIIQKEQFKDCLGVHAQECTAQNFAPIGTGPFVVDEFRPNDVVSYVANPLYRDPTKPYFQTATLKGGGDAASAARAVLETGEFDYAWNLQVEPEILVQMMLAGRGTIEEGFGTQVERLLVNLTNSSSELDKNQRSLYLDGSNPHPFLADPAVRQALSMAIDRQLLVDAGYGAAGKPSCNIVPAPPAYASTANESCKLQDLEAAKKLLDDAGWLPGPDGVRVKNGVRLSILYQTSTNSVRQGTQALIKQVWKQIGVETELRNIDGAVFFGSDASSPDTLQKFYADIQMYTNNFDGIDPEAYVGNWRCDEIPGPHNQWVGNNNPRTCSAEYDAKLAQLSETANSDERIKIIKELNDMLVQNYWMIPLIHRAKLSAISNSLKGVKMNAWDSELWNVADWHR